MKAKMYSEESNSLLHDHILDGAFTTHEGLQRLKDDNLISNEEYTQLLEANFKRLLHRIREFRVREGMMQASRRLTAIGFALLFTWMQVSGDDVEARRPSRSGRATRTARASRNGRRRNDSEPGFLDDVTKN